MIPTPEQVPELYYRWSKKPKFRVIKNGCWEWTASRHKLGYALSPSKIANYVHRAVYIRMVRKILPGMTIDHVCRNRWCVNPQHLEQVSLAENIRRAPRTKLTAKMVKEIRSSSEGHTALGRKFGVTAQAILRVRKRLSWR